MWKKFVVPAVSGLILSAVLPFAAAGSAEAVPYPVPRGWKITVGGVERVNTGFPNQTVVGNLTVTEPDGPGYITAWPCTSPRPTASTINFVLAKTIANGVIVKSDENGDVCFYGTNYTHLIWDQTGTVGDVATSTAPTRLLDTRSNGGQKPLPGAVTRIQTGARGKAVTGNLTVTQPDNGTFATVYPCDQSRPATSNINFAKNQTVANGVVVKTNPNGEICVYTPTAAHIIWDQTGSFTTKIVTAGGVSISSPSTNSPVRIVDTRTTGTKPGRGSITKIHTAIPDTAVFGNLTVTEPEDFGWVSTYPCSETYPPLASSVNYSPWQTVANNVFVKTDSNGDFCVYTTSTTHLIWDQSGNFRGVGNLSSPSREMDTRTFDVPKHPGTGKDFSPEVAYRAPWVWAEMANLGIDGHYLPGVLAQIQQESSGDPNAVNDWDSNWKAGHASFGLMQTTYPTFTAYTKPECRVPLQTLVVKNVPQQYTPKMVDVSCNVYAGMNYVKTVYNGSLFPIWNTGKNLPY